MTERVTAEGWKRLSSIAVQTGLWDVGREGCPADIAPASEMRPATAAKQTSNRMTLRPAPKSTAGAAPMVLTGFPVSTSRRQDKGAEAVAMPRLMPTERTSS